MNAPSPIPTGLHQSAQGCRVREATLGHRSRYFPQPHRGCITPRRADGCNPFRVDDFLGRVPRVASRTRQPWADGFYPVGVNRAVRPRVTRMPQRRLVAELDAEAAQMDSVRALLPRFEAKIQRVLDRVWGTAISE